MTRLTQARQNRPAHGDRGRLQGHPVRARGSRIPSAPQAAVSFRAPRASERRELGADARRFPLRRRGAMVAIDMAKYGEATPCRYSSCSPPGYIRRRRGRPAHQAVRPKPYCRAALDEIGECPPRTVQHPASRSLEDGRRTDAPGAHRWTSSTLVIIPRTSAASRSRATRRSASAVSDDDTGITYDDMKSPEHCRIKKVFRPECRNGSSEVHRLPQSCPKDEGSRRCVEFAVTATAATPWPIRAVAQTVDEANDLLVEKGLHPALGAPPPPVRLAVQHRGSARRQGAASSMDPWLDGRVDKRPRRGPEVKIDNRRSEDAHFFRRLASVPLAARATARGACPATLRPTSRGIPSSARGSLRAAGADSATDDS